MKRKVILSTMLFLASTMMVGQTSSSQKAPLGASYSVTDGNSVTKTGETLSSSTQYYNVVQVTNGTLNLENCTISKTGDGASGDNSYVTTLVNNGTINRNGYTLTATSTSGSGTINETTGIAEVVSRQEADNQCYDLTGRRVNATTKGLVIRNGKKIINQ